MRAGKIHRHCYRWGQTSQPHNTNSESAYHNFSILQGYDCKTCWYSRVIFQTHCYQIFLCSICVSVSGLTCASASNSLLRRIQRELAEITLDPPCNCRRVALCRKIVSHYSQSTIFFVENSPYVFNCLILARGRKGTTSTNGYPPSWALQLLFTRYSSSLSVTPRLPHPLVSYPRAILL